MEAIQLFPFFFKLTPSSSNPPGDDGAPWERGEPPAPALSFEARPNRGAARGAGDLGGVDAADGLDEADDLEDVLADPEGAYVFSNFFS